MFLFVAAAAPVFEFVVVAAVVCVFNFAGFLFPSICLCLLLLLLLVADISISDLGSFSFSFSVPISFWFDILYFFFSSLTLLRRTADGTIRRPFVLYCLYLSSFFLSFVDLNYTVLSTAAL